MVIQVLRRLRCLRLGWVRVQVDALEVEDVILGLSQWFNGFLPGTESESSKVTSGPPNRELAEAVARIAEAMVRSFILWCVWMCGVSQWRSYGVLERVAYVGSAGA